LFLLVKSWIPDQNRFGNDGGEGFRRDGGESFRGDGGGSFWNGGRVDFRMTGLMEVA